MLHSYPLVKLVLGRNLIPFFHFPFYNCMFVEVRTAFAVSQTNQLSSRCKRFNYYFFAECFYATFFFAPSWETFKCLWMRKLNFYCKNSENPLLRRYLPTVFNFVKMGSTYLSLTCKHFVMQIRGSFKAKFIGRLFFGWKVWQHQVCELNFIENLKLNCEENFLLWIWMIVS